MATAHWGPPPGRRAGFAGGRHPASEGTYIIADHIAVQCWSNDIPAPRTYIIADNIASNDNPPPKTYIIADNIAQYPFPQDLHYCKNYCTITGLSQLVYKYKAPTRVLVSKNFLRRGPSSGVLAFQMAQT